MFFCVIGIIVAVILITVLGVTKTTEETNDMYGKRTKTVKKWKLNKKHIAVLLVIIIMLPGFINKVPANSVGIKYSPFTGTSQVTLDEGFHKKSPFDKIYHISTEVQTMTVEGLTTQTKDAQFISTTLDIKYKVNQENAYLVFKQFRTLDKMSSSLIVPTTQRVLELTTTKYNVIDVLGEQRSKIYAELETSLADELTKYGVEFYSISITDMDAGDAIEKAITAEAVAKKEVETADQQLLKAQTEAKQKSVMAQAEQDAAKIEAETKIIEAKAEKDANELLNQSLSDEVLKKMWIEKWNGEVSKYSGSGMDFIIDEQ